MSPYWLNNSCSPYTPYASADGSGPCTLGNLAQYAIRVEHAADVVAGVSFAQRHNVRLTIKNTGHDAQGRSAGAGSLGLWMHNLKDITFPDYSSPRYQGRAARMAAGIQVQEAYEAASDHGLTILGGFGPSVGVAGGWLQGGGHGPLASMYGLGADNTLEFEVVTADGVIVTAAPDNDHSDLYWALSGGGPGNYGVVLSVTVKAWPDTPVAGAMFTFANTNEDSYWKAIRGWMKTLLTLNRIPGLSTASGFSSQGFTMNFATLPGGTTETLREALASYMTQLKKLGVFMVADVTHMQSSFFDHYKTFADSPPINITMGSRLIPASLVQDDDQLDTLVSTMKTLVIREQGVFALISNNVSLSRVGIAADDNAVLPAWRDALFLANFGVYVSDGEPWANLSADQTRVNHWQTLLRDQTPGSGAYGNEATFNNAMWKEDYFGANYDRLLAVKRAYDPHGLFWANTVVGSDAHWVMQPDGRLCRPDR
ncbi:FAD-binding domain-containing protein [Teratosphaeria destructans]|uniref:FAD-binding domain-containing protein n=1 Tax=Teratosphaeria destructans TaxID=418781 RepID=A0A9W7SZU9_9PEZI|nr:FAD-binding domain-containing protein [Teratosphaeria destructans]